MSVIQQLVDVAASPKCLLACLFIVLLFFLFSVLFICIQKEILEESTTPVASWVLEHAELASNLEHLRQLILPPYKGCIQTDIVLQ